MAKKIRKPVSKGAKRGPKPDTLVIPPDQLPSVIDRLLMNPKPKK